MGAWGAEIFDDDMSLDALYEAIATDAKKVVRKATSYSNKEYLEVNECQEIIVAGVVLDALLNGTKYDTPDDVLDEWLSNQDGRELEELRGSIIIGLKQVLSEKSELNELWRENEEEYSSWSFNVERVIYNLAKA